MRAIACPQISRESFLAAVLASAKSLGLRQVCQVPTELCETINDLDELMSPAIEQNLDMVIAKLNQTLLQQFSSQMPAAR